MVRRPGVVVVEVRDDLPTRELDPHVVDQWGIPVLRFHFKWSGHELRQAKDMQDTFKSIVEELGAVWIAARTCGAACCPRPAPSSRSA